MADTANTANRVIKGSVPHGIVTADLPVNLDIYVKNPVTTEGPTLVSVPVVEVLTPWSLLIDLIGENFKVEDIISFDTQLYPCPSLDSLCPAESCTPPSGAGELVTNCVGISNG